MTLYCDFYTESNKLVAREDPDYNDWGVVTKLVQRNFETLPPVGSQVAYEGKWYKVKEYFFRESGGIVLRAAKRRW